MIFVIFKMAATAILDFKKTANFNGQSAERAWCASANKSKMADGHHFENR